MIDTFYCPLCATPSRGECLHVVMHEYTQRVLTEYLLKEWAHE